MGQAVVTTLAAKFEEMALPTPGSPDLTLRNWPSTPGHELKQLVSLSWLGVLKHLQQVLSPVLSLVKELQLGVVPLK